MSEAALTSDTLPLVYVQKLQFANAETVRHRHISLSVASQSVLTAPSFSLRSQAKNDLHSGWSN